MATTTTHKDATLTVPGKSDEFPYEWDEITGDFDDALAHANGNQAELAEAYFDSVNAKSKASARQKVYNANIDAKEKAKSDAVRNLMTAFGLSKEAAQKMLLQAAAGGNEE